MSRLPRSSGILLHPTSLPGRYGIGDLGAAALPSPPPFNPLCLKGYRADSFCLPSTPVQSTGAQILSTPNPRPLPPSKTGEGEAHSAESALFALAQARGFRFCAAAARRANSPSLSLTGRGLGGGVAKAAAAHSAFRSLSKPANSSIQRIRPPGRLLAEGRG